MARRSCKYCGKPLPANVTARCEYCPGGTCRKLAYKKRKAKGESAGRPKPAKPRRKRPEPEPSATLTGREFDRMMDGSMEDELRHVRDRLRAYVDDPDTPASAMPNIVAKYLTVCERLHDMAGGDPLLDALNESEDVSEVEDAGASIV
ncbi:hypothetical protein CS006_10445 [Bifidobacterium primatium]|uniref:Uncharacterized protein n=2 Tax=Bifidobacterium TaxID=1678 RepID=A0A2M9H6E0_9BIFI|nr:MULTISPECIES: hypothetical protein [Bifidobacterium]NEG96001.1 hypothetical protein [Bifidobacterium sp. SMB2]NEH12466.1 hypothetical protein [Bifidobacterium saimiriisciurei]PJM72347.1 hypothetical protein CS006_10445 [Bifidobacterium primatium]